MIIYFLLIGFVLICPIIAKIISKEEIRRKKIIVTLSSLAIYLLCVLKSTNVGIDIPGYESAYYQAGKYKWLDTSYIYFEHGYIFLEKLFFSLGFSFQTFLFVVYAVIFIPVALFIYRYSKNITLSFIIYICYQTLVFNLSGLRQSIAISICLCAYMILDKKNVKYTILFFLIVILASQFHRSAILFLLAYFARRVKIDIGFIVGLLAVTICTILFRDEIVSITNKYTGIYQAPKEMTLGGNFLFLVTVSSILLLLYATRNTSESTREPKVEKVPLANEKKAVMSDTIKMLIFSVVLQLIFNGSNVLRVSNYFSLFMVLALPDLCSYFDLESRRMLFIAIVIFMIILFYAQTLKIAQFNCVPYTFFWQ